jgi:flagellar biosynthesis regulator FlaF
MPTTAQLSVPEEQAFQLSQAALKLDHARAKGEARELAAALDKNLEVWVALRTIVTRDDCSLAPETKQNLVKLSHFVAEKVFAGPEKLTDSALDTLINVNLQISEGFLEGAKMVSARH